MAKKTTRKKTSSSSSSIPPADERTGDTVSDVRVTVHPEPADRPIRICLRRGGAPVALSVADAELVLELLEEAVAQSR